tara:strand:- start:9779 stop:11329 length:1551 start_codon:yes stop_codon:yes gene_type:complete
MSFNPYQQRMPSFQRPPPRRSSFNPFTNRGIGGFSGMFGGRGPRRRPQPRGRFPQSFGGFGGRGRGAAQPRRGRGRGGMFGGFPQQQRGRQSPFSNMFGGIGGFGGRRQFNPFMNQFGGGGFNISGGGGFNPFGLGQRMPSGSREAGGGFFDNLSKSSQPQDWDAFLEKIRSGLGSNFGLGGVKEDIDDIDFGNSTFNLKLDPNDPLKQLMGTNPPQEAPAAPPPMETTAPVMPAAPHLESLGPVIPEMPLSPDPKYATFEEYMNRPEEDYILEKYQGPVAPTPPTVGPPGTTIAPAAPQDQIDTQPLTRQLGPNVPEGFIPPSGPSTSALVKYWNPTTGETWTASSGGWTAPEGWERAPLPTFNFNQPPPASSPQPLPMQPLPIGQQPLLPSMPGKEQRPPPFIGRGPAAPLSPIPPVNVVQENIEREIIPPQLPVAPIQQATPNILGVQDREPGFTQADYMRPQMTGTPATAFPSLLPHQQPYQQFAPTNLMGEPQKKALRDLLSRGRFGPGGF